MPASRARTAICSAPLEWPSRPGLPSTNFSRRPSLRDTRSTSARKSSRPTVSLRAARPTPVGARYSPKLSRSVKPHSPVVTPALAQSIDLLGLRLRRDRDDSVGRARERRRLALHESIDADHCLLAAFDRLDAAGVRFHELMFHIALLDG